MRKMVIGGMLALLLMPVASAVPARAESPAAVSVKYEPFDPAKIEEIRFPEAGWSADMMNFIRRGAKYMSADLDVGISPPPANGSEETKREIADLVAHQEKERLDEETYQRILYENRADLWDVFEKEGMFPVAASAEGRQLVKDALFETSYFITREKKKYQRARPIQLSADLTLAIDGPPHAAYPSGHAGQAQIIALVLGLFEPARAGEFKRFAHDIGARREIAGVHYPSDSAAGRHVAEVVFENLMKNPDFVARVEAVKAEISAKSTAQLQ